MRTVATRAAVRLVALLLLALGPVAALVVDAPAGRIPAGTVKGPIAVGAGSCLDGGSGAPGASVAVTRCNGEAGQQWTLPGDGTIRVHGQCLALGGARAGDPDGARAVVLAGCTGAADQVWLVDSGSVVNGASGLCLLDGAQATGYPCGASTGRRWMVPSLAVDPSGQAMPVGDLPGWKQIVTDDFTREVPLGSFPAAVSDTWTAYQDGWKDTSGNGTYYPSKVVSIHNGVMNLHLHTENGVHMVSAPMPVLPGAQSRPGGQTYGRYAVRFRADPVPGYKTAWLLWPDSDVWNDGEIDFPEGNLDSTFAGYLHPPGEPQIPIGAGTGVDYSQWHTAVLTWSPDAVTYELDGHVVGGWSRAADIPNVPMHWVLQTETQLTGGPPPDSAAGNVQIDWIAVYARA